VKQKQNITAIYQAALKVFAEFGYKKTTIEDITTELGMTKGNLYLYVRNKRELYQETVAFALMQWQDYVRQEISSVYDVQQQFLTMCNKAVEYLSWNKQLRNLLKRDPDIFPLFPTDDPYADINEQSILLIQNILKRGIEEGTFRVVDVERISQVIFLIYKLFIVRTYIQTDDESIYAMYEETLELLTRGLFKECSTQKTNHHLKT